MPLTPRDVDPALLLWPELRGGAARLVNHSENHTFLVDTPDGRCFALRIHREHYQSRATIESELTWLVALRRDTEVPVPCPVVGSNGALIQTFETGQGPRLAVLFEYLPGMEPDFDSDLPAVFTTLGHYAARMHDHVANWRRPTGFERQAWTAASILDADGLWGNWRVAPGVNAGNRPILDQLDAALRQRLADYGMDAGRYGLIHADMRLGNLLLDGEKLHLIDFDDAGFCWLMYDFAAAISFHETHAIIPELKAAWLEAYRQVRPLGPDEIAALDSMVMLRRMALLAWIGSHSETSLAQQHMPGFADGTAQLAGRYLRGPIWR